MKVQDAIALINVLYHTILDRSPDQAGQKYWLNKLVKNEINDIQLASELFNSKEYQEKRKGGKL